MDILYACCAGLDVHKETVVVSVRRRHDNGKVQQVTRTYGTMTAQLLELADWLEAEGVTHLAMESTGVYWKPIWNLLEDRFTILLVNAQHIKNVPGRKTDVKDSEWIAQLLQCGLLRGSFVPPTPQRQLRELTRQRRQLVHAKASVANRIQKVLEDANIRDKKGDIQDFICERKRGHRLRQETWERGKICKDHLGNPSLGPCR